jgi:TfoX/Sxy family transcriptional regulator of competence genes
MAYDQQLAGRVRTALGKRPRITERKMFGGVAFLHDGRMCCGVTGTDLVVRVRAREMPRVMAQRHVRPMDFTGRPLRGFVFVSEGGYRTAAQLRSWIARALRFVESQEAPAKRSRRGSPESHQQASRFRSR